MLKDGLFYEYNGCVVNFFQDKLQKYSSDLKKEEKLHIFANMATGSVRSPAVVR